MDPISSITNNGAYGQIVPPKKDLDMATFMQLLTTQLANQNPLDPMSDADFYGQLAQLGQVQGIQQMQSSLQMSEAAGLIGKTVTATTTLTSNGTNGSTTGVVQKVSIANGTTTLTVMDMASGVLNDVELANITQIK